MNTIIKYLIILTLVTLLDFCYLYLTKNTMLKVIKNIQKNPLKINWIYLILCYLTLSFTIYYFIIKERKSILYSFILGVCIYGIYETSNMAIFTKWKQNVVIMDTIWGGLLFSLVNYIYKYII
jgi:uncharacterized membrane protein